MRTNYEIFQNRGTIMKNIKKDAKFFNDLYTGLGVEHYTISQLLLLGYEAYKMTADFGFDIITSNQMKKSYQKEDIQEAKYLQIKSRIITPDDYENYNGNGKVERKKTDIFFGIKKENFEIICAEPNAYVVFYFLEECEKQFSIPCYFWMSSCNLKKLYELGYFKEIENEYRLTVGLRKEVDAKLEFKNLIEQLQSKKESHEDLKKIISTFDANRLKTHTYVRLHKADGTEKRLLKNVHLYRLNDLSNKFEIEEDVDNVIK